MRKIVRKADIALISFFCISAFLLLFLFDFSKTGAGFVLIKVNGELVQELPITENIIFEIPERGGKPKNIIEIKDGKVKMIHADCPDGVCLRQGEIQFTNETIVCLPNRVVIEVKNHSENEKDKLDVIVK